MCEAIREEGTSRHAGIDPEAKTGRQFKDA
jgi:hypothetical protein